MASINDPSVHFVGPVNGHSSSPPPSDFSSIADLGTASNGSPIFHSSHTFERVLDLSSISLLNTAIPSLTASSGTSVNAG